jgi:DNA-binding transcriptional LysR family regulator
MTESSLRYQKSITMKLDQVRNIIAIAERGSIRAAARHLGIAQPAITRGIRELERELGVPLFERQSTGVILTAMGEIFLRRAKAAQGELLRAKEEIDQHQGQVNGRITVCLSSASQIALLPESLRAFRSRFTNVELNIFEGLFSTAEAGIRDGTLDCYIGPLAEENLSADLLVEKLFDNERAVFGRIGHPLAGAKSLADLVDAEWIYTTLTIKVGAELGPLFEAANLPAPKIAAQTNSSLTMITMAAYTDLLTMLPVQWCKFPWGEKLLQRIHIKEFLPAASVYIVRRGSLPLTPAAEYFCDMIRRAGHHYSPAEAN